jgi:hypothetical protein
MSPDLLPAQSSTSRARLRFYDIAYKSLAAPSQSSLGQHEGRFREAVVAFLAQADGINGEVSLFMWTDSDAYMMWGREVFGFPLIRGAIDLSGPLWEGPTVSGCSGRARLSIPSSSASLDIDEVQHELPASAATPWWITPRRILRRAGLDDERREVLMVRPMIRRPGVRYAAAGHVSCEFEMGHPLHGLEARDADCDVVEGFELVVGSDVEVL